MLKFHNDHMRRQRNPPNRKSRELQEVAQSMNPGAGETLNLTSPQRWALPFSGGEHFICFTLMFPPTLMWPHSNPHICPCSCGFILSLPNPPRKVLNDKLAISANTQCEVWKKNSIVFHLTSKITEGRTWITCSPLWSAVHSFVEGRSPICSSNYSQLRLTQVITQRFGRFLSYLNRRHYPGKK